MESGRLMVGLANSRWKKREKVTELFVCGLGCIVWNKIWAKDARLARLSSRALLSCLTGLADGLLHAFLYAREVILFCYCCRGVFLIRTGELTLEKVRKPG